MKTDLLIIGSGIAGMSVAIKLAETFPEEQITLITKKDLLESSTNLAQGGIAVALGGSDSFQRHMEDTIRAGAGLCNHEVVSKVISEAPERLQELQRWGIDFDRMPSGEIQLGKESGHSASRIVHYKDVTGNHVASGLLKKLETFQNVSLKGYHFAIDLLTIGDPGTGSITCAGAVVVHELTGHVESIYSRMTVIATGGIGQVYETTTNPLVATGDGIAMASRAGAAISDMEFIQFHPTAFYCKNDNPSFLISEAVRGFGGYLRNKSGERFVFRYDARGELASRDIVSKAIYTELIGNGEKSVFLDCTHLPPVELRVHFPNIYEHCLGRGLDISTAFIPVAPAAHYLCGGIVTDPDGRTNIDHLYACGECACTGLHGANRLASNSLLEALVFAQQIFLHIKSTLVQTKAPEETALSFPSYVAQERNNWLKEKRIAVREMMDRHAGIVRCGAGLSEAKDFLQMTGTQLDELYSISLPTVSMCELRNIVRVARLIISQSLERRENRGTFYNLDLEP
jgi:L-aspartate oxidase